MRYAIFILILAVFAFSTDWICSGGDLGRTFSNQDTLIKPPLRMKWRVRTPGFMQSNAVVAEGKVFTRYQTGPTTMAVDIQTGDIAWRKVNNMGTGQNDASAGWNDGI